MYEPRKIPFSIDVHSSSLTLSAGLQGPLKFTTSCFQDYKCIHFCGIASEQLKKQSVQDDSRQAKRTLLETLDLISSWKSKEYKFCFLESNKDQQIFDFERLLPEQREIMEKIQKKDINLSPVGIYMEVENIDKLVENDIFSMIAILSIKANGSFDVQEYFIETLNGIIYPLTTIFESGVHQHTEKSFNDSIRQHSDNTDDVPSIHQQKCVVCHTYPVTRTNMPCRHACACKLCFQKLDSVCPICRQPIRSYLVLRDESFFPRTEEEEQEDISSDIRRMGWWEFIKAVWNAG